LSNDKVLNPTKDLESVLNTKKIFWYTFPLFITQIMSLVNNVSDKYILKYYLDIDTVGVYGKAYLFGSSLGLFIDSLMLLWMPYVIKNKEFILFKRLHLILKAVYVFMIMSLVILVLGVYLYFSNQDVFGLPPTFILVFFIIFSAFALRIGYQVTTPILSAYDKTSLVAKISIFSMVIGLVANLLLIPSYGMVAAAVATLISFLSYSIISIIYTVKLRREITV
ncbi:polysaccharide biosynthesis C-terminal domain-containing protein, partial [Psychrobacter sp. 5A.1]|uniref:lipopolysaccharide biosynthesis protein n=1 Tax=Psychrobacter sp. 5A.1 TaxID=3035207 RepID=UPI0025B35CCB